jgi:hypothetical protein
MGASQVELEERRVDNPLVTYAQFVHELQTASPYAGVVRAQVNLVSLVGGAHRFFGHPKAEGREARLKACETFRTLYETGQIGGARAVDPSVEPVDGGWANPDASFERGVESRIKWDRIASHMSRVEMRKLQFVIIGEWGPTAYARWTLNVRRANSQQISKATVEFRHIVDKLAAHLHLQDKRIVDSRG